MKKDGIMACEISPDSSNPGYFVMAPSKPSMSGPRRQLKDRIKIAKRFLQFGGRDRSADKCPACKYVITKPVFKMIPGGRMVPKKSELTCGIIHGVPFAVFENTYCKNHEPMTDQNHATYYMEEIDNLIT